MRRMPRTIFLLALLLGATGLGCQSTAGHKNTFPPKDQPLPPPTPPSWENPNQTTYTLPAQGNGKLAPKMELAWYIFADQQNKVPVMAGQSQVGPDGTLLIGPYGQYQVAGLTMYQAGQIIEKGIRQYQPNTPSSRVQLQMVSTNAPANQTGNFPTNPKAAPTTWSSTSNSSPGSIKPVIYVGPDWTAINPLPQPSVANPDAGQRAAQTPPASASPASIAPASRRNARSPIMTYVFGPRYQ